MARPQLQRFAPRGLRFSPVSSCSVAEIAKARLRLVLASDRMAVSPALKRELCSDIVNSMQEFVVVDKGKEVQFAVQRSQDSGSVYLVQVPVTRVRPRLQLDLQDLEP